MKPPPSSLRVQLTVGAGSAECRVCAFQTLRPFYNVSYDSFGFFYYWRLAR